MKKNIPALAAAGLSLLLALLLFIDAETSLRNRAVPPETIAAAAASDLSRPMNPADRAEELLAGMTAEEKVWQLMLVFPEDLLGIPSCSDMEAWADAMLQKPAGGFILSSANMTSEQDLRTMLGAIGGAADIPAFLCVDEEGGTVARLRYTLGVTTDFAPMYTYRAQGVAAAYQNALTIGSELRDFGFNVNFAPVADVWTNSENTVIGRRAYSDRPEEAARLVAAAVEGFTDGGVIATLKHFPGHGDTAEDSHHTCAYSGKSLEQLEECEFLPFISGIDAGAGMVMAGHITLPEIDPDHPATLSAKVINGLLRETLGYDGLVITDSFRMAALAPYAQTEAAVMGIQAGCDMILAPADPDAAVAAILEAVDPQRIDESVLRILKLKLESGILQ